MKLNKVVIAVTCLSLFAFVWLGASVPAKAEEPMRIVYSEAANTSATDVAILWPILNDSGYRVKEISLDVQSVSGTFDFYVGYVKDASTVAGDFQTIWQCRPSAVGQKTYTFTTAAPYVGRSVTAGSWTPVSNYLGNGLLSNQTWVDSNQGSYACYRRGTATTYSPTYGDLMLYIDETATASISYRLEVVVEPAR